MCSLYASVNVHVLDEIQVGEVSLTQCRPAKPGRNSSAWEVNELSFRDTGFHVGVCRHYTKK